MPRPQRDDPRREPGDDEAPPILGEWPYDDEMVGLGFFPAEVSLRHDPPGRRV